MKTIVNKKNSIAFKNYEIKIIIVAPVLIDVSQVLNSAPCKKPNKN